MVILEKSKIDNKIIGNFGEEVAIQYLQKRNYQILEKNFRCYYGEIDIIAKLEDEYVFFEVKTRRNENYGKPAEAVNFYKKKHIWNCARYYLYKNKILNSKIRFDVIEITINHIKNMIY